jgi:hypothetical protein
VEYTRGCSWSWCQDAIAHQGILLDLADSSSLLRCWGIRGRGEVGSMVQCLPRAASASGSRRTAIPMAQVDLVERPWVQTYQEQGTDRTSRWAEGPGCCCCCICHCPSCLDHDHRSDCLHDHSRQAQVIDSRSGDAAYNLPFRSAEFALRRSSCATNVMRSCKQVAVVARNEGDNVE